MPAAPVHSRPLYLAALRVFRRLPAPVRRTLVRAGTPMHGPNLWPASESRLMVARRSRSLCA